MQDGLLGYPVRGPSGLETLAIGSGLHLLAVYLPVVPYVVVIGYLLSIIVHVAADADAGRHGAPPLVRVPPTRAQLRRLTTDGLRGTVVIVGFLIVPTIVVAVTARGVGGLDGVSGQTGLAVVVGGTASLLVAAAFLYPLPAALAAVGRHRRLRAAVHTTFLRRVTTDARYFVGWTTGVTALALGIAVASPVFDIAVGFVVVFYAECVAAAAWGWGVSLGFQ